MKGCTYSATLDELLKRPTGLLALHGRDSEGDQGSKPEGDPKLDESKDGGKPAGDKGAEGGEGEGKEGEKPPTAEDRRIANLTEEKERHRTKRAEAETALAEAQKTIAKLQKDGTPDDALKKSNDEITATNAKLVEQNQALALQVAFLSTTGHDWVDPEAAMQLADLSTVEFDEKTGKAIGLKSALDKLAKDKPYLLKSKDDDGSKSPAGTGKPPAPRGTTTGAQKAAADAALRAKYPALRR